MTLRGVISWSVLTLDTWGLSSALLWIRERKTTSFDATPFYFWTSGNVILLIFLFPNDSLILIRYVSISGFDGKIRRANGITILIEHAATKRIKVLLYTHSFHIDLHYFLEATISNFCNLSSWSISSFLSWYLTELMLSSKVFFKSRKLTSNPSV